MLEEIRIMEREVYKPDWDSLLTGKPAPPEHTLRRYAADKSWHADILRLHTSRKYKERWNNRMVLSLLFIGFIVIKFYKCTDKKDKQIKYPCLFARTGKYD